MTPGRLCAPPQRACDVPAGCPPAAACWGGSEPRGAPRLQERSFNNSLGRLFRDKEILQDGP